MRVSALILMFLTSANLIFAQSSEKVEMADVMRSNGKIYIVVVVLLIILTGLFMYLFTIDKKITKVEKSIKK
jgi:succinate dehydrogenase hydrophobic anchor subunit